MLERFHPDAVLAEARPKTTRAGAAGGEGEEAEYTSAEYGGAGGGGGDDGVEVGARTELEKERDVRPRGVDGSAPAKRRLSPIKRELKNYVNGDSSERRMSTIDIEEFINQRIQIGHRPRIMTVPGACHSTRHRP